MWAGVGVHCDVLGEGGGGGALVGVAEVVLLVEAVQLLGDVYLEGEGRVDAARQDSDIGQYVVGVCPVGRLCKYQLQLLAERQHGSIISVENIKAEGRGHL